MDLSAFLPAGYTSDSYASGVSSDGTYITVTGDAINSTGGFDAIIWVRPIHCKADVNNDDVVDFFDYLDFVAAFSAGGASADFNRDGVVDFFDYLDFVAEFSSGC